jgi:hypothetical protein
MSPTRALVPDVTRRLLDAVERLFYGRGVPAVGIDAWWLRPALRPRTLYAPSAPRAALSKPTCGAETNAGTTGSVAPRKFRASLAEFARRRPEIDCRRASPRRTSSPDRGWRGVLAGRCSFSYI